MPEWFNLVIQAGGAITVCGLFLWYLKQKQIGDDAARVAFLEHLANKDENHAQSAATQLDYLKSRDIQSKAIAESGHAALRHVAEEVNSLRLECKIRSEKA